MKDLKIKLIFFSNMSSWFIFDQFILPYGLGILTNFLRQNNYYVTLNDISVKIKDNYRRFLFPSSQRIDIHILQPNNGEAIDYLLEQNYDNDNNSRKVDHFSEQLLSLASCEGYDLIGISIMNYFHFECLPALLLLKKIKSLSNAKVVLGGPFINKHGREVFNTFPLVDYMIVGDGQVPLLKLIEHLEGRMPIEDVPSLIYRQNGSIKSNPRKFFSIEDLYMPDFSDLNLDAYRMEDGRSLPLPYQISRGCVYECSFCDHNRINPSVELKSHRKVVKEIKEMKERYQSNVFHFCDDAINCSYEYLDRLCDLFIEEKLDLHWTVEARADNLDRKILHKMRKAGCSRLAFGLESGSNRILKSMVKGITSEQASQVLRDSYEEGIKNIIFMMAGYPHETKEDILETVEFIRKNSEYIWKIGNLTTLKLEEGSPLYNNPDKFGIENLRPLSDINFPAFFAFDEINGLKWEEKVKQQRYSYKKILWANFKYILSKEYRINFVPFWFYFWLRDKCRLLYKRLFFRIF